MRLIDADAAVKDARLNYGDVHDAVLIEHFLDSQPTISLSQNNPLTLEELLKIDGEPVWCECKGNPKCNGWYLVNASERTSQIVRNKRYSVSRAAFKNGFWVAYRRKPDEVS